MNRLTITALTALAVGLALFAVLLILRADNVLLFGIPVGVAALWFVAQTARARKAEQKKR